MGSGDSNSKTFVRNADGNPIRGLHCMKVVVNRHSNVIGAPIETGQTSFDNKVILPMEVTVTAIICLNEDDDFSGYSGEAMTAVNEMIASREFKFYSVIDGDDVYDNLILKECPATRSSSEPDFLEYELKFVEAMLIQDNTYSPANPQDTDTVSAGNTNMK